MLCVFGLLSSLGYRKPDGSIVFAALSGSGSMFVCRWPQSSAAPLCAAAQSTRPAGPAHLLDGPMTTPDLSSERGRFSSCLVFHQTFSFSPFPPPPRVFSSDFRASHSIKARKGKRTAKVESVWRNYFSFFKTLSSVFPCSKYHL